MKLYVHRLIIFLFCYHAIPISEMINFSLPFQLPLHKWKTNVTIIYRHYFFLHSNKLLKETEFFPSDTQGFISTMLIPSILLIFIYWNRLSLRKIPTICVKVGGKTNKIECYNNGLSWGLKFLKLHQAVNAQNFCLLVVFIAVIMLFSFYSLLGFTVRELLP